VRPWQAGQARRNTRFQPRSLKLRRQIRQGVEIDMATAKTASASSAKNAEEAVSAQDIEESIARIRGDIAELAGALKSYGAGKSSEYRSRASAATEDLSRKSQDALNDLTAELQGYEKALTEEIRRRPLQSLGIAAGIGFLIAALVRR
jgi:ElaB/YqjD/DUF883 family membrane-anchored ribosome-binding protein